jgi:hypothetical protein
MERRLVKRRGKLKALVSVARSILVIVWHLLADPSTRFHDLGADSHANRIDTDKKIRNHIRQLQALGYTVALNRSPHSPPQPFPAPPWSSTENRTTPTHQLFSGQVDREGTEPTSAVPNLYPGISHQAR